MGSVYPETGRSAWILAQRGARSAVDPLVPGGFFLEHERDASGAVISSAVILLTNKECPWRCLMCDLWRHTLEWPVPPGAIPAQIDYALNRLGRQAVQVKLYNSGSFFDAAAIPRRDYPAIAARLAFAERVIVESHPRLVGRSTLAFRDLLRGKLEVALGLETSDPVCLGRLNKGFDLPHYEQACRELRAAGIAIRAFVLVRPPFVPAREAVVHAVRTARYAFEQGAGVVCLIPTRPGNGVLDRLQAAGEFEPPSLTMLEDAQREALALGLGRVFADTWDLQRFASCDHCFGDRLNRLQQMNEEQVPVPGIRCASCGNAG